MSNDHCPRKLYGVSCSTKERRRAGLEIAPQWRMILGRQVCCETEPFHTGYTSASVTKGDWPFRIQNVGKQPESRATGRLFGGERFGEGATSPAPRLEARSARGISNGDFHHRAHPYHYLHLHPAAVDTSSHFDFLPFRSIQCFEILHHRPCVDDFLSPTCV